MNALALLAFILGITVNQPTSPSKEKPATGERPEKHSPDTRSLPGGYDKN